MTPILNWKELELLSRAIREEVQGLFVDRIIVPERPRFPLGYVRGEWAIRITGRRLDCSLLVSIRPQHPYIALIPGKGFKASTAATHPPFELALGKILKGTKLVGLEAVPRERVLVLWFTGAAAGKVGLVLVLIPNAPECYLIDEKGKILIRSRTVRDVTKQIETYIRPDGAHAPEAPTVRTNLVTSAPTFLGELERELDTEAFALRRLNAEKSIRETQKLLKTRIQQSTRAAVEAKKEADWKKYGDLLKGSMGDFSTTSKEHGASARESVAVRLATDFETGEQVEVPCDPKLTLPEQVERFYQLARRKTRRLSEADERVARFSEQHTRLADLLTTPPPAGDWKALEAFELAAGRPAKAGTSPAAKENARWLGRTFSSKDGWAIWVGKSRDENLELTFKSARGNDLWLHVRGRPGAHTVIPLVNKKSVPLETLLDAAALTVFYSGGEKWGKTEVDYTYRKYVRRIKDSTEVSYTHNKTLIINPDDQRLKRLLGEEK